MRLFIRSARFPCLGFPLSVILPLKPTESVSRWVIDAHRCGKKSFKKNTTMEEQLKTLLTACIVANIPQIAAAVAEELKKLPKTPQTMTRKEAAKALSVSLPTLDLLISKGEIRGKKLGHRIVIPESEIENLLASGEPVKYIRGGRK